MTTYKLIAGKKSPSLVKVTRELFWANTCNLPSNINIVKEGTITTSLRLIKITYVQKALKERNCLSAIAIMQIITIFILLKVAPSFVLVMGLLGGCQCDKV